MSGITGYPSQEKLTTELPGYGLDSKSTSQFVTVSETHDKHVVQDVRINGAFRTTAIVKTLTSIPTDFPLRIIVSTAHGALKGDFIRFEGTAANPHFSAMVLDAPDADTIILGSTLPVLPVSGDEFFVLRHVVPLYDEDGTLSVSSGPIQFIRDSLNQQVIEDTVDPSNNVPLPVKLTSVTGDINITAGDLNVQLTDTGANPDITRIGDGTNRLVMTAVGEATVSDADGLVELVDINTELDAQTALLTTIDAGTGAIATITASIDGKLPAALGQQLAAASLGVVLASDQTLPLPAGAATEATLALLEAKDFATETTLAALAAAAATEATSALILADTTSIASDAGNILVATSNIDETTVSIQSEVAGLNTKTNPDYGVSTDAIRTASQIGNATGAADFGAGNASAQTLRAVIATDQAPLPSILGGKAAIDLAYNDYSSTSVTTAAYVELVATLAGAVSEIEIFDSSGQALILATGAATSEVDQIYITPGGNGRIPLSIAASTRVSIKALTGTANVGFITINFYG
jgi:hypothetical protein